MFSRDIVWFSETLTTVGDSFHNKREVLLRQDTFGQLWTAVLIAACLPLPVLVSDLLRCFFLLFLFAPQSKLIAQNKAGSGFVVGAAATIADVAVFDITGESEAETS